MSQHEVTLVRGYWMQQEAAVKKDSKEALTAAESRHSAELALVRAELSAYKQGEADRLAAVKQQYDSKPRDACCQHAAVVAQLQQELAAAKGLQSTQRLGQTPSPVTTPDHGAAQSGPQEPHISLPRLELLSCTSTTVSTDIAQCRSSSADAAVTVAAQSTLPAAVKDYPLLEKWLTAGTDQITLATQESVLAKHITSATKQQDALPACDTIRAVRNGSAVSEQLQQQTLTSHSPTSTSKSSSSKMQVQADSALTCKASRSSSSGERQLQTCPADPGHLTSPSTAQTCAVELGCASFKTAASCLLTSSSTSRHPSLTIAAQSPASCDQPILDQQPQQQLVTASAAGKGHITKDSSSTGAGSAQTVAGLVDSPTSAQAHSARVADAFQASSVTQTVLGWASGVKKASIMKKTMPDQATDFENFQPVAVPVWATANSDDKESSSLVDSYTKSTLFSRPWDAEAAAAELDASECDEVDYELLWTKGPQYWYGQDDDWGIDDE